MGLFNLFGGDSSSSSKVSTEDNKVAADNGALALRVNTGSNTGITIGSDNVAQAAINASTSAIESNKDVLSVATHFLDEQLTGLFNLVDHRAAAADQNVQASQSLAASVVNKSQQTETDSLIKLISVLAVAAVAVVAFKSKAIKL